jgi:hypothetical protein
MRQAFAVLFMSVAFLACSSSDTSTPSAACNSLVSATCNKEASCNSSVSVSTCISAAEALAGCANLTCPQGTTYNSNNVNTCLDAVNNASCPFTTTPPSCDSSLFCQ